MHVLPIEVRAYVLWQVLHCLFDLYVRVWHPCDLWHWLSMVLAALDLPGFVHVGYYSLMLTMIQVGHQPPLNEFYFERMSGVAMILA